MVQPPCFVYSQFLYYVCKLQKALDGPKQAFQAWFQHLRETLLKCGIRHSITNSSMFLFQNNQHSLISLVYVHITYPIPNFISQQEFCLKIFGRSSLFFGTRSLLPWLCSLSHSVEVYP